MKKASLQIHIAQFSSTNGEPLKTLKRAQSLVAKTQVRPNDWWVFPEMWPAGFRLEDRARQARENKACQAWLQDYARRQRCFMVGSMLEVAQGKTYNSAYLMDPKGRLLKNYRKIHLFQLGDEHRKFAPGKSEAFHRFSWGGLGLGICYDLRFPELFRLYSKMGAKLILLPSAWPKERLPHFLSLLQARAIENQCFIVGANKIGHHDSGIRYGGHSVVFGPWGEKLGELGSRAGILSVRLDMSHLEAVRKNYPFLNSRILA